MLLPENIHPESTLLYSGALIIKALKTLRTAAIVDLYIEAREHGELSMPLFILSLDWLFLVNCIALNENGEIAICS